MKLDIRLLRRILNAIQKKDSHFVNVSHLLEDVKQEYEETDAETFKDIFCGHLYLLKDNKVIEEVPGEKLGISYGVNGHINTSGCFIRMTSSGYDYAKMLNKNGFADKIKNLTLTEGQKIAEYALLEGIKHFMNF